MLKAIHGFALVLLSVSATVLAQTPAAPVAVAAAPADVASPEAIIQAVYTIISGPKGALRDWPRFRSLMVPGAVLSPTGTPKGGGAPRTRVLTIEDYIAGGSKIFADEGFFEHGAVSSIWRYGHIATVRSPYESRHAANEPPFQRGINSFQLSFDGTRWWIVSISWEGETPEFPLPAAENAALQGK